MKAMVTVNVIIIGVLSLWFASSLLLQVQVVASLLKRRAKLLPRWLQVTSSPLLPRFSFFSWVPTFDFELLYRDKLVDTQIGPWISVPLPKRTAWRFVWNPGKRHRFVIEDLSRGLLRRVEEQLVTADMPSVVSYPYVNLACYVAGLPASPLSIQRQFMIARSFAEKNRKVEIEFVSPFFVVSSPE